jgi:hypothetical protein
MSKLPAFQFYPADWRADIGIQSLSYHDRGVWFEILCLMHQSEERGRLVLNGRPMSDEALSRALGLPVDELTATLERLLDYGVATRDDDGALVNRRMLRDEAVRRMRAEAGRRGGHKEPVNIDIIEEEADDEQFDESVACNGEANHQAKRKQTIKQNASKTQANTQANFKQTIKQNRPPSSSSSSSSLNSLSYSEREARSHGREPPHRGTRIPEHFTVDDSMREWAAARCPMVDIETETEKFVNYWSAKAGRDARKTDWRRTWQNWMLRAEEFRQAPTKSNYGTDKRTSSDRLADYAETLARYPDECESPEARGDAGGHQQTLAD